MKCLVILFWEILFFSSSRDRKWFNLVSLPISPIGMVSMNVRSKSFLTHHFINSSTSSSLMFLRATQLIFIFRLASFAASIPNKTSWRLPILVMFLNFFGSRVSSEIFIRLTPFLKLTSVFI